MAPVVSPRPFLDPATPEVAELAELLTTVTPPGAYPHADEVVQEVVIYRLARLEEAAAEPRGRREVLAELAHVLDEGPGALVIRGAVERGVLDRVTAAFQAMVDAQRAAGGPVGDHFATAGANDRVWNVAEKLALAEPGLFADYHATSAIDLAATAWLGPRYQFTAQLNVVNPGGAAQNPHRDYHLGFMTPAEAADFPAHVHQLSPRLTLQGAIAHVDMPVETGPTLLLPHSHKYPAGYVVAGNPEVAALFDAHRVQLPLAAGDALFFNPALLHAAGTNRTADVHRMGNLLQISSAFGRAMETVDRRAMSLALYPALLERRAAGWPADRLDRVIAASAEGYAFPTDLDRDPPVGGLAPASQADLVRQALAEGWPPARLDAALADHDARRRPRSTAA